MPCYSPLTAYRTFVKNEPKIVFNKPSGQSPYSEQKGFNIPCGRCWGCRLNYARQWAIRCTHEAQYYEEDLKLPSCFITLTFDPKIRNPVSLNKRDFQLFMKRLRKKYSNIPIRYFHSGEYGEKRGRPHYHAILFGADFNHDRVLRHEKPNKLYTSKTLNDLWPFGFHLIGNVTFETASYTARYIMKKQYGDDADKHYKDRIPEYSTMSLGNGKDTFGLGYGFFQKYKKDIYPHDYVVTRYGFKVKPPRYYDSLLSKEELEELKKARRERAEDPYTDIRDPRWKRLKDRERYKIKELERVLETRKL
tara:strand:+ start:578 stop:1495 length:918 start_codon:yes stop_codon:yes gene_type:complete